jgi:hypothetical protein
MQTTKFGTTDDHALQLVLASPKAGREQAFEQWYAIHLSEFLSIPGVISARRSKVLPLAAAGLLPSSLAMYELHASTMDSLDAEVARRMEDGRITRSDAVNDASLVIIKAKPPGPAAFGRDAPSTSAEPSGKLTPTGEYQLIVFSEPATPSVEHEYHDACDHHLIPALLREPGFVWAQRFIVTSAVPHGATTRCFMLFTLRGQDIEATYRELLRIQAQDTTRTAVMKYGAIAFLEPVGPV